MIAATLWLCALVAVVCGCEPAERTQAPPAAPPSEAVETTPPKPATDPDRLRTAIESAEHFARLETAFFAVRQIEDGRKQLLEQWRKEHGEDPVSVALIGTRTGFPAFTVSPDDGGARRIVVVTGDALLSPPSGLTAFARYAPERNALRWAAAWLLLDLGVAREPLGPWSDPPAIAPRWAEDVLTLSYVAEDGRARAVSVRVDPNGGALLLGKP